MASPHSSSNPYICSQCGGGLRSSSALRKHVKDKHPEAAKTAKDFR